MVLIGAGCLGWGLTSDAPLRAWQAFHVNFLYWMGLAFAGIVISAIFEMTSSGWGQNVRRLAESSVGLLPLGLVAYLGVIAGHHTLFEAGHHGHELIGGKVVWLEPTFLLSRDGGALLFLALLGSVFVYYSVRPGLMVTFKGKVPNQGPGLLQWIMRNPRSVEEEKARSLRIRTVMAPIVAISYALVMTLIAFDQVMSLDATWISTLFGAYFFITNLYLAWATLSALSVVSRRGQGTRAMTAAGRRIRINDLHDLGKLTFAFCMLSADFFWSQFVVIWYGNIPEETPFIIRRIGTEPWSRLSWAVAFLCYAIPFGLLLFKKIKRTEITLFTICLAVMCMVWIERYLLVVPSLWHEAPEALPLGALELGITLGFLGVAALSYRWMSNIFLRAAPIMPVRQGLDGPLPTDDEAKQSTAAPKADEQVEATTKDKSSPAKDDDKEEPEKDQDDQGETKND
jgi:hypothetical protein